MPHRIAPSSNRETNHDAGEPPRTSPFPDDSNHVRHEPGNRTEIRDAQIPEGRGDMDMRELAQRFHEMLSADGAPRGTRASISQGDSAATEPDVRRTPVHALPTERGEITPRAPAESQTVARAIEQPLIGHQVARPAQEPPVHRQARSTAPREINEDRAAANGFEVFHATADKPMHMARHLDPKHEAASRPKHEKPVEETPGEENTVIEPVAQAPIATPLVRPAPPAKPSARPNAALARQKVPDERPTQLPQSPSTRAPQHASADETAWQEPSPDVARDLVEAVSETPVSSAQEQERVSSEALADAELDQTAQTQIVQRQAQETVAMTQMTVQAIQAERLVQVNTPKPLLQRLIESI